MPKLLSILVLLVLSLPALAIAQAAPAAPWQAQVLDLVLSTLGAVVAACVPLVAVWLARKLRLGHEVLVQAEVTRIVAQGVAYAEEQARKRIALSVAKTPTGGEKAQIAAEWVLGQLAQRKLPEYGVEQIKAFVEAHLGATRPADTAPAAAPAKV